MSNGFSIARRTRRLRFRPCGRRRRMPCVLQPCVRQSFVRQRLSWPRHAEGWLLDVPPTAKATLSRQAMSPARPRLSTCWQSRRASRAMTRAWSSEATGDAAFPSPTSWSPFRRDASPGTMQWPRTSPGNPRNRLHVASLRTMERAELPDWFKSSLGERRRVFRLHPCFTHGSTALSSASRRSRMIRTREPLRSSIMAVKGAVARLSPRPGQRHLFLVPTWPTFSRLAANAPRWARSSSSPIRWEVGCDGSFAPGGAQAGGTAFQDHQCRPRFARSRCRHIQASGRGDGSESTQHHALRVTGRPCAAGFRKAFAGVTRLGAVDPGDAAYLDQLQGLSA